MAKFICDKDVFTSTRSVLNLLMSDTMLRCFALLVFVLSIADIANKFLNTFYFRHFHLI